MAPLAALVAASTLVFALAVPPSGPILAFIEAQAAATRAHSTGYAAYPANGKPGSPEWDTSSATGWTAGFFPQTLLELWRTTGAATYFDEANAYLVGLAANQRNTGTHDVGARRQHDGAARDSEDGGFD